MGGPLRFSSKLAQTTLTTSRAIWLKKPYGALMSTQSTICPIRGWAAWAGLGLATKQPMLVAQRPRSWAQLGHARLGMPKHEHGHAQVQ